MGISSCESFRARRFSGRLTARSMAKPQPSPHCASVGQPIPFKIGRIRGSLEGSGGGLGTDFFELVREGAR